MKFELTSDQRDFAASVDALLAASDPVGVARAWAAGDPAPGLALWARLAEQGVHALLVPEVYGGLGATPLELVIVLELIGKHAVPGPWVESLAHLPLALRDGEALTALAAGAIGTVAAPPHVPYALDADVADFAFHADGTLRMASVGPMHTSVDRTRRLFEVTPADAVPSADPEAGRRMAVLATAAQLLGCGERVLADSVAYVKTRKQFGREIGSYQAVKHALADVRIALDFARPLMYAAALDPTRREVAAARVLCTDAAYLSARTGLQVHGAIGYTAEFDLSIWLTKIRALVTAWGTPAQHRADVLEQLVN